MRNLLHANLRRLTRSGAFFIALLAELAYIALAVMICWDRYATHDGSCTLEYILTAGYTMLGGYIAIPSLIAGPLLSVYLGTDYSDNTLRNKLIVGRTRREVYLADLLTCVITAVGLEALFLALTGVLCVRPILGMSGALLRVSWGQMLAWIAVVLLARTAYAAVVKLLATVLGNKTAASVAVLLLVVFASFLCASGFSEIQYIEAGLSGAYPVENAEGRLVFWNMLLDILPTGQYFRVSRLDTPGLWRMPLLSLAVLGISTGAGLAFFQHRDLK